MNLEDRLRWVLNQPERKPGEKDQKIPLMRRLVTRADVDRIKSAKNLTSPQDRPEQPKEAKC